MGYYEDKIMKTFFKISPPDTWTMRHSETIS